MFRVRHTNERPRKKTLWCFFSKMLLKLHFKQEFDSQVHKNRASFSKIRTVFFAESGHFFLFPKKDKQDLGLFLPGSCAPDNYVTIYTTSQLARLPNLPNIAKLANLCLTFQISQLNISMQLASQYIYQLPLRQINLGKSPAVCKF